MIKTFSASTSTPILMLGWAFYGHNTLCGVRLMRSQDARATQSAYANSIRLTDNMRLFCKDVGISLTQPDGRILDLLEVNDCTKNDHEICFVRKQDTYKSLNDTKIDVFTFKKEHDQFTQIKQECRARDELSVKGNLSLYQ